MEINPRFGVSLLNSNNEWLDAYLSALGIVPERSRQRAWFRRQRRIYDHWMRQLLGTDTLPETAR